MSQAAASITCQGCGKEIGATVPHMQISDLARYHKECFTCAECQFPLKPEGFFTDPEETKIYCENDYAKLYGPKCAQCGLPILGKVLVAMGAKWHHDHFACQTCSKSLAGLAFFEHEGLPQCRSCNENMKQREKQLKLEECVKCGQEIPKDQLYRFKSQPVHVFHLLCEECKQPLDLKCKELDGKLYCPKDFEELTATLCSGCGKSIRAQRSISALGGIYHQDCFVCNKCLQPFAGSAFMEYSGKPYCLEHYRQLVNSLCWLCGNVSQGKGIKALGRHWCEEHFVCYGCHTNLLTTKHVNWDQKPFCKSCYDSLPRHTRQQLHDYEAKEKDLKY